MLTAVSRSLLAVVMLTLTLPLPAQEGTARLPYEVVYEQLSIFDELAHLDRISWSMSVRSLNPAVSAQDIAMHLDDGKQVHNFPLGPEGQFLLPLREDWHDLPGLMIETNQPKGSLNLDVSFSVKSLTESAMSYASLLALGAQIQQAMNAQAKAQGQPNEVVTGLRLIYEEGTQATVSVMAAESERVFAANPDGTLRFVFDKSLAGENPNVLIDPLPSSILPLTRE